MPITGVQVQFGQSIQDVWLINITVVQHELPVGATVVAAFDRDAMYL
jgi:hypothetical protein